MSMAPRHGLSGLQASIGVRYGMIAAWRVALCLLSILLGLCCQARAQTQPGQRQPGNANATEHGDGDGQDNRQEWIGGTDPTNGSSAFSLSGIELTPGGSNILIRWPTLSGRLYDVSWASDLLSSFLPLGTDLPYTQDTYQDSAAQTSAFYRVHAKMEAL